MSKKEFFKAMRYLGLGVPQEEADALYDSFDPDGGGSIDYAELNKALKRRVPTHGECQAAPRGAAPSTGRGGFQLKLDLVGMRKADLAARRAKADASGGPWVSRRASAYP